MILDRTATDLKFSAPHLLGPGTTLTEVNKALLAENASVLADKRESGVFAEAGQWQMREVAEIRTILSQRKQKAG